MRWDVVLLCAATFAWLALVVYVIDVRYVRQWRRDE